MIKSRSPKYKSSMRTLLEHKFKDGDMLILTAARGYVGFHGLEVFALGYAQENGGVYDMCNEECYLSESIARAALVARRDSPNPFEPIRINDSASILLDMFKRCFGESTFGSVMLPADWDGLMFHVIKSLFGGYTHEYDAKSIMKALEDSRSTSSSDLVRKVKVEIPLWKLIELVTAITALTQVVREREEDLKRLAA